jgi:lipopolysaccharide transport system permease protein
MSLNCKKQIFVWIIVCCITAVCTISVDYTVPFTDNLSYLIKKSILGAAIFLLMCLCVIIINAFLKHNLHRFMFTNVKGFFSFIQELYVKRRLIWDLTRNDLKTRFAGSHLGIVWAFVMPVITILIFWFVFESGFKTPPVTDYPFILWLSAGIVPWFFFLDCVSSATNSIIGYSFLVKKVVFRVSILPIVKILAALTVHLALVLVLIIINALYGYYPTLYMLQLGYYLFAMIVLLLGISWITSAAIVFFRDMGPFVSTALQLLFWGTPIFWSIKIIPEKYHVFFKINPVFYLIQGYRDCFINKIWFWERWEITIGFWCVTIIIFIFGAIFFLKLKPHFADVI